MRVAIPVASSILDRVLVQWPPQSTRGRGSIHDDGFVSDPPSFHSHTSRVAAIRAGGAGTPVPSTGSCAWRNTPMCTALATCRRFLLQAIVFTTIVASAESRQVAADDAEANSPAANQWVVPDGRAPTDLYDQIARNQSSIETVLTLLIVSLLLMLMQATGFALVETGLLRSKGFGRSWVRYLMICPLTGMAFWAYGFAIGWGNWFNGPVARVGTPRSARGCRCWIAGWASSNDPAQPSVFKYGLLGTKGFCLHGVDNPSVVALFLFMMVFMTTAALRPSRRPGRTLALEEFSAVWLLGCPSVRDLRQLGVGRRLARTSGCQLGTWAWRRRLRRLGRGLWDGGHHRPSRVCGAWPACRTPRGRQAANHARPQPPCRGHRHGNLSCWVATD